MAIELPAGAPKTVELLTGVSCSSSGDCEAVGNYTGASGTMRPMVVDETGRDLGPGSAEVTAPAGDGTSTLNAISCNSKGPCGAVGARPPMTSPWSCCPPARRPSRSHDLPHLPRATMTPAVAAIGEGNNSTGAAYEGAGHTLWFSWQTYGT